MELCSVTSVMCQKVLMFYCCTFYASAVEESTAEALRFSVVCPIVR